MLIMQLIIMVIVFSLLGVIAVLWNILFKKRHILKNIRLFLLFPIGQICMIDVWLLMICTGEMQYGSVLNGLIGILLGFIADAILVYIMFMQGEKEEMRIRLAETEQLMEIEKKYYQTIRERQEEVSKICHDFNNHLTTALQIARNEKSTKSEELLEQLCETVEESTEQIWCENAVINAVLTEKYHLCERKNIVFDARVVVKEDVPIDALHLCSVFCNLLDNAVGAAEESGMDTGFVSIRASLKDKYMYIKAENTSKKQAVKVPKAGHGYGLQIIKRIANQYNGKYQAEWKDDVYSALVVLELEGDM